MPPNPVARANIEKLATLNSDLQTRLEKYQQAIVRLDKAAADALARVDHSEVAKLQKEVVKIRAKLGIHFTSRIEDFEQFEPTERPCMLDSTGPDGASAEVVRAAQIAWAKYLGESGYEKTHYLDENRKLAVAMVLIPPGRYQRDSLPGVKQTGEEPQQVITLTKPLWVGKYEVTQKQYDLVMGNNPSSFKKSYGIFDLPAAIYPVETVSYDDCVNFTTKASSATGLTYRLLSEAEWEYAYRAGTRTQWYNGDDKSKIGDIAEYKENNNKAPARVGGKTPNAFGLYDMAGNVEEWCLDSYLDRYSDTSVDPQGGPASEMLKVKRGGSWTHRLTDCQAAHRDYGKTDAKTNCLGFRLACVPSLTEK